MLKLYFGHTDASFRRSPWEDSWTFSCQLNVTALWTQKMRDMSMASLARRLGADPAAGADCALVDALLKWRVMRDEAPGPALAALVEALQART